MTKFVAKFFSVSVERKFQNSFLLKSFRFYRMIAYVKFCYGSCWLFYFVIFTVRTGVWSYSLGQTSEIRHDAHQISKSPCVRGGDDISFSAIRARKARMER